MDKPFQREGAESNSNVGREFEAWAMEFFRRKCMDLETDVRVEIGVNGTKPHRFDLGSHKEHVLVECKSHTWTKGRNVPSAKITTWDQAMYYFHAAPPSYRKILFVLRDYCDRRKETLAEYYVRTKAHLIPHDVEIWEFNPTTGSADRVATG